MPPLRRLDTAGDAVRQVIRAYHGSPYDFDRFDARAIGAGEGAQSFGHGLYFAESPETAEVYRRALSGGQVNNFVSDDELRAYYAPGRIVNDNRDKVLQFIENKEEPWNWMVQVIGVDGNGDPLPFERPRTHRTAPTIRKYDQSFGRPVRRTGKTYEVEIGYPEESLLDWDAPLSSQPEAVRRAFASGRGSYHGMIDGPRDGERLWYNRSNSSDPRTAAREFVDAGIPGIRYLDGISRNSGQGTRNYVIFPGAEDQIRILRKYGLMAPVAAGAMDDGEQ